MKLQILKIWLCLRFPVLRKHLLTETEEYNLAMAEFRSLAIFFGHDISNLSDEEIAEGLKETGKRIAGMGLNAKEMTSTIVQLSTVARGLAT